MRRCHWQSGCPSACKPSIHPSVGRITYRAEFDYLTNRELRDWAAVFTTLISSPHSGPLPRERVISSVRRGLPRCLVRTVVLKESESMRRILLRCDFGIDFPCAVTRWHCRNVVLTAAARVFYIFDGAFTERMQAKAQRLVDPSV